MTGQYTQTKQIEEESSFYIYVDLFDKGDFSEMNITCQSGKYHVNMDNIYLGTITKSSDNQWEVVNGTIPAAVMSDITKRLSRNHPDIN